MSITNYGQEILTSKKHHGKKQTPDDPIFDLGFMIDGKNSSHFSENTPERALDSGEEAKDRKKFDGWFGWYALKKELFLNIRITESLATRTNVDAKEQEQLIINAEIKNIHMLKDYSTSLDVNFSEYDELHHEVTTELNELTKRVLQKNAALGNREIPGLSKLFLRLLDTPLDTPELRKSTQSSTESGNYFIKNGDVWHVRFGGGAEVLLKENVNLRTLAEYLMNPHKDIDPVEVYRRLHAESLPSSSNVYIDPNDFDNNSLNIQIRVNCDEVYDAPARKRIEGETIELAERIEEAITKGQKKLGDELSDKFEQMKDWLKKDNADLKDNGRIIWGNLKFNTERSKTSGLIYKHLKRAQNKCKQKNLNGLAEHIEKYIINQGYCYRPPDGFPEWDIKT